MGNKTEVGAGGLLALIGIVIYGGFWLTLASTGLLIAACVVAELYNFIF